MRARLFAVDDRINWAAVSGALCLWDVYAKYGGRISASRWFRAHRVAKWAFILAVIIHLATREEQS